MIGRTKRPAHEVILALIEKQYNLVTVAYKDISSAILGSLMGSLRTLLSVLEAMVIPAEHVYTVVTRLEALTRRDPCYRTAQAEVTALIKTLYADYPNAKEDAEAIRRGMREGPDCTNCGFTMQRYGTGLKCPNCDETITTTSA